MSVCKKGITARIEWFNSMIDANGPVHPHDQSLGRCWLYTGRKKNGYGYFILGGAQVQAHRFSYFIKHGFYPENCACHSCDNRACVNPDHLWDGTKADNNRDRDQKDRANKPKGERNAMAKLTETDVREIRDLHGKLTHREIAERYGVHTEYVKLIFSRKRWSHVT